MFKSKVAKFNLEKSEERHDSLAVLFHAFTSVPQHMETVAKAVRESMGNVHVIVPQLPLGLFSTADASTISRDVLNEIKSQIQFRDGKRWREFEEIVLIGHSVGALIARKVYVLWCGDFLDGPSEADENAKHIVRRKGVSKVRRIILLAGMNRGWSITHHLGILRAIQLSIGAAWGHILDSIFGVRLVIFQARRGSAFLTQLRLEWLALTKSLANYKIPMATTIQLLGTIDDLVSPDDNIDLTTGRDFIYLDVPHSGHPNVIEMDDTQAGQERRRVFKMALSETEETIRSHAILPADPILAQINWDVKIVVFVIHGIRDDGYWTHKIFRKIVATGQAPPRIYASETARYGYFAMAPFLLPWRRREKVEWLMDQYVEAKALYPNATNFSYVGHSNGTYLLTYALKHYSACQFDNVVFAGSVVRKQYKWLEAIGKGQIKAVLNYVATADWVVAFLPGAFEILRLQDIGSAGHNGFDQATANGPVFERRYIRGTHSAALVEENWDDIAHFILNGQPKEIPDETKRENNGLWATKRRWYVVIPGYVAPLLWIAAIVIALALGWLVWTVAPTPQWAKTLAVAAYAMGIWRILTWL